jgi:transcriptional regulator with XRE-family HTH domain
MEIGNRIHDLRIRNDLTQKELADKLNVTPQAVSRWEQNLVEPGLQSLQTLAAIFNISLDEFVDCENENIDFNDNRKKIGVCYKCNKAIYEGDQYTYIPASSVIYNGKVDTIPAHNLCANCNERVNNNKREEPAVTRPVRKHYYFRSATLCAASIGYFLTALFYLLSIIFFDTTGFCPNRYLSSAAFYISIIIVQCSIVAIISAFLSSNNKISTILFLAGLCLLFFATFIDDCIDASNVLKLYQQYSSSSSSSYQSYLYLVMPPIIFDILFLAMSIVGIVFYLKHSKIVFKVIISIIISYLMITVLKNYATLFFRSYYFVNGNLVHEPFPTLTYLYSCLAPFAIATGIFYFIYLYKDRNLRY